MKSLLWNLVPAFVLMVCVGSSAAQDVARRENTPSQRLGPRAAIKNEYVEVMDLDEPLVAIHYPWARHEKPCVEVRLLEATPEAAQSRPLYFLTEYMKGTNLVAIYRCEELSEELPAATQFTRDGVDFLVEGRRNLLGRPSVLVRARAAEPGPRYGTRAVFCMLHAWAIDGKLLYLELPQGDFGQRGQIEVIFYRGENILWSETAEWPGYRKKEGEKRRRGEEEKSKR